MTPAPSPAAPRVRPPTVTIAGWLLYLAAALEVVSMVVALSQMNAIADATEEAWQGFDGADAARTATIVGTTVGVALAALFAAGFIVLAIFNNRGKNASRITTWVIGGIGLCCGTFGLIANAAGNSLNFGGGGDDAPDQEDVQRLIDEAVPSWYEPITITVGLLVVLSLLAVVILLALPPSNEFFRKQEPVWQPPPGYPPAGQPPAGYPPSGSPPPPGSQPPGGSPPPGGPSAE